MKKIQASLFLSAFLFITFSLASCGNSANHSHEQKGKEYTSAYICPMHCEGSGSDQPGKCPVCNMDYVANKDTKATEEHSHDHDHSDPNHTH